MSKFCWLVCSLFVCLLNSSFGQISGTPDDVQLIQLNGSVTGLPAGAVCSVELTAVYAGTTARPITAFCMKDGSFAIDNVKRGSYDLVVHFGARDYSRQVMLMAPHEEVEIRIPGYQSTGSGATVSTSQMAIPSKATEALQKAMRSLQHSDLNKAGDYVAKALQIAPRFAEALTVQAVLQMARQDFKSALQSVSNAAAIDPKLPMTQLVRASALNALGYSRQAQVAAEEGIRLGGNSWQGHYELAKSLIGQRNLKQALLEIDRAAAVAPKDFADLFLLRASVTLGLNDIHGARESLNRFSQLKPGDARSAQLEQILKGAETP